MLYGIAGVILTGFLLCYGLSRKEKVAEDTERLLIPFYRMGLYLYKKVCIWKLPVMHSKTTKQTLKQMYPGEDLEQLCLNYYVRKLAISFALVLAGTLFALLADWKSTLDKNLYSGSVVKRGEYTEGNRELELGVEVAETEAEFKILVRNRILAQDEIEELYQVFWKELPERIRGENPSLQKVSANLELEETYGDYPFELEWKSDRPEIVSTTGTVVTQEKPQSVELEVSMSYGEWSRREVIPLLVLPATLSTEQQIHRDLQLLLETSEEESRREEIWLLPTTWEGEELEWKEKYQNYGMHLWLLIMGTSVLIFFLADNDLREKLERRKESMKQEYPELLHKLVLYLGAGMTVRGAFGRVTEEYGVKSRQNKRAVPIYQEMKCTCRELRAGVSEGAAYEHFGKRTGVQHYIRLSTLLQQNLKKGNSALLERLREEAEKAMAERIQQGRRLGEEAGAKMLLPMMMMLAIVMIMIMLPAFSTI